MDTNKTYSSAAGAARDFFGNYPSAKAFMEEWKQLTDDDKKEIKEGMIAVGIKIEDTPKA